MKKSLFFPAVLLFLFSVSVVSAQYYCPPGTVPVDPNPGPASAGTDCIAKIERNFDKGEKDSEAVELKAGESYWVAANGCPRAGTIRISISDYEGNTLKSRRDTAPRFCFVAKKSGFYRFNVSLLSTTHGDWGAVDSCLSVSKCGQKKAVAAAKK